ncbi:MAG: biotin--[acetyl-CoA-carboxylase] ligase [Phycisphaerales bacterium]
MPASSARNPQPDLERWRCALARSAKATRLFQHVEVVAQAASTQDMARAMAEKHGCGCAAVTLQQTAGRGRSGRKWVDTPDASLAASIALTPIEPARAWVQSISLAIAAARAVENSAALQEGTVAIKWPNDLMLRDRKLGGILIEQNATAAICGIGINVGDTAHNPALPASAISLFDAGCTVDRCDLACALLAAIDDVCRCSDDVIDDTFQRRNWLRGRTVTLQHDNRTSRGRVVEIELRTAIRIACADDQIISIPIAHAHVQSVESDV